MANPDTGPYIVGDTLMLTCVVDPLPSSTGDNATYSWQCASCFAEAETDPTFERVLSDMDSSSINCTVAINGTMFRSDNMFNLQVIEGSLLVYKCVLMYVWYVIASS